MGAGPIFESLPYLLSCLVPIHRGPQHFLLNIVALTAQYTPPVTLRASQIKAWRAEMTDMTDFLGLGEK